MQCTYHEERRQHFGQEVRETVRMQIHAVGIYDKSQEELDSTVSQRIKQVKAMESNHFKAHQTRKNSAHHQYTERKTLAQTITRATASISSRLNHLQMTVAKAPKKVRKVDMTR